MADNLATDKRRGPSRPRVPVDTPEQERRILLSITDVALSLSTAPSGTDVRHLICERLWELTGATVLTLSLYDAGTKSFRVQHVASSASTYDSMEPILGARFFREAFPVPDELYHHIMTQGDEVGEGCQLLFSGRISPSEAQAVDQALGLGLCYGFGLIFQDTLLGALGIMMPEEAAPLSKDIMNAYRAIAVAALHQARQSEEIQSYQGRLRTLGTQLHLAQESERRRIACSIHDNIAQSLVHLKLRFADVETGGDSSPCRPGLEGLSKHLDDIIGQVYDVTYDLSPPVLHELGLESALDWLLQGVRERDGLAATLDWQAGSPTTLPRDLQAQAFHMIREVVQNVVKHSKADTLQLRSSCTGDNVVLEAIDNGVGMDLSDDAAPEGGFGVFSLKERVRDLGGHIEFESPPGQGTRVTMTLPTHPPAGEAP